MDPLAPAPGDPCSYSYLGPIWCCGPVGQVLFVNGTLRMDYNEALIPPGVLESDLVLLEWDNAAQVMRPNLGALVVHDTVQNFFFDPAYLVLGHVAIGIRTCNKNPLDLILQAEVFPVAKPTAPGLNEGFSQFPDLLYLWRSDGVGNPVVIDTDDVVPGPFIGRPDGGRVLYEVFNQNESTDLFSAVLQAPGDPVQLAGASDKVQSDPLFGWLRQGAGDHAFFLSFVNGVAGSSSPLAGSAAAGPHYDFRRRLGDASAAATTLSQHDASNHFIDDLRQSATGALAMLSQPTFDQTTTLVDVVNVPGGGFQSSGIIPGSGGSASPRFLTKNNDLYEVDTNQTTVSRRTPPGVFVSELFDSVSQNDTATLVDFALAADDTTFAAVADLDDGDGGTNTELWLGRLGAGVLATLDLGNRGSLQEMVWHPDGKRVYLQFGFGSGSVQQFSLDETGMAAVQVGVLLPVSSLSDLDVSSVDGRLAYVVRFSFQVLGDLTTASVTRPGLYIADPDGTNAVQRVPSNLDGVYQVRWRFSWRLAPGMNTPHVR